MDRKNILSFIDCSWAPEGGAPLFEGLSGELAVSECVVLMGPSGSGKSVLFRILSGLLPQRSGQIHIASSRLGMLFQQNALFDSMSVLENLMFPMRELGVRQGDALLSRAKELLSAVSLSGTELLRVDELSGGMQKRLGIARALAVDPDLVLYDEPTAGLDPITSRQIAELLQTLTRSQGCSSLVITNDPMRALMIADRIWFLNRGVLKDLGKPEQATSARSPWEFLDFFSGNRTSGPSS
jgi:phospholipid/cholesterol/gamma-HCH transport system ATP-binding protein